MNFFFHFLKNPKKVAALKPSSRFLARAIIGAAELENKQCVVELGSGTGVFTQKITEQLSENSIFFAMETNPDFVRISRKKNPKADIHQASAEFLKEYLLRYQRETCDCVISALPWATLGSDLQEQILDDIYVTIEDGGVFLTIANIQGLIMPSGKKFRQALEKRFSSVERTKIIWRNLMPSIVYICKK